MAASPSANGRSPRATWLAGCWSARRPSASGGARPRPLPTTRRCQTYAPLVARLLKSQDRTTRDNAVTQLIRCGRPEALRRLLPALNDNPKNWPEGTRGRLLQALSRVQLPEAVPLVRQTWPDLEHDEQFAAAVVLAHHHAGDASAKLKAVLADAPLPEFEELARELVACDGLGVDEMAAALQARFARAEGVNDPAADGQDRGRSFSFSARIPSCRRSPARRMVASIGNR